MSKIINDKKLFRNFVPSVRDKNGDIVNSSYFIISEDELKGIAKLNKALKKSQKKKRIS